MTPPAHYRIERRQKGERGWRHVVSLSTRQPVERVKVYAAGFRRREGWPHGTLIRVVREEE